MSATLLAASMLLCGSDARAGGSPQTLIPDYRILGAMLRRASAADSLAELRKPVVVMSRQLGDLGREHGIDLRRRLETAIDEQDRELVVRTLGLAALLEALDAARAIERDRLTGWGDAKRNATISYLTYGVVESALGDRYPRQSAKVREAFVRLIARLGQSDLTTPPATIEALRVELLDRLNRMTVEVAAADSTSLGALR